MDGAIKVIDPSSRKGTDFERASIDVSVLDRGCPWLCLGVRRGSLPEPVLQHVVVIAVIDEQEFRSLAHELRNEIAEELLLI